MNVDRKVHDAELEYLGPVAIAMFIEIGWLRAWPMSWTRAGLKALRNGFGRWEGTQQVLPLPATEADAGGAYWTDRRTRLPRGTNLPATEPIGSRQRRSGHMAAVDS